MNDLRFAFRQLRKSPGFTVIAVLTLALGIGANSAIFSVVDAMLLRPLPFKDPEQIVMVWGRYLNDGGNDRTGVHSFPDYTDLREQSRSFSALAAYTRTAGTLAQSEDAQEIEGVAVTPEIFAVLGVPPLLGRAYTQAEAKDEGARVVVLTYPLWQRAFGGDRKILGREINLSGRSSTVIGVMPPGWKFPVEDKRIDYVIPLQPLVASALTNREAHFLSVIGRLQPGVQMRQAEAELSAIAGRLSRQYPDSNSNFTSVTLATLHDDVVGNVRPALLILLGAVALVLFIACANVANLLLARAAARSREIAIRTALGATRQRIVRQLLCESLLLALLGGSAGLLLAVWGVAFLDAAGSHGLPHLGAIQVNPFVALFTFGLALGSTILFGLIPALQVSRPSVNETLQQGSKGSTGGVQTNRLRAFLVISQVALSLLLLVGAGLLIKSFHRLRATDPGFQPEQLLTASITLPRVRYPEPAAQIRAHDAIMEKIAALPGVEWAGGANPLPLSGNERMLTFMVSGAAPLPRGNHPGAGYVIVKPDYFQALKTPLRSGRVFTRSDTQNAPLVVMINETFARKFFPDRNPIGEQVMIDRENDKAPPCEVVGVVADSRHESLAALPGPEMYVPFAQDPTRSLDIVLRVAAPNLAGLQAGMKRAVQAVDKDLFVPPLEPMSTLLDTQLARPRFNMFLLGLFAGVAMILAAIGIYGVIAYSVAQRTREIGIRMALGAQRGEMLGMILRQSLTVVAIGLAIGVLAAFAGTRLLASLLYGVDANDLLTYAAVVGLLGAAALLASYIPARRAMKVDPMIALRYE